MEAKAAKAPLLIRPSGVKQSSKGCAILSFNQTKVELKLKILNYENEQNNSFNQTKVELKSRFNLKPARTNSTFNQTKVELK